MFCVVEEPVYENCATTLSWCFPRMYGGKAFHGVEPNRGASFLVCRTLRCGAMRNFVFWNCAVRCCSVLCRSPAVRCGAVRCGFFYMGILWLRCGAVFLFPAVRCGLWYLRIVRFRCLSDFVFWFSYLLGVVRFEVGRRGAPYLHLSKLRDCDLPLVFLQFF